MKSSGQTNFVYLLILIAIVAMVFMNINQDSGKAIMPINEVASEIRKGTIAKIVEDENTLVVTLKKRPGKNIHKRKRQFFG